MLLLAINIMNTSSFGISILRGVFGSEYGIISYQTLILMLMAEVCMTLTWSLN